jgi:class 3 adenylate cyclase
VHVAARIGAPAAPGETLVSRTVGDLAAKASIAGLDAGAGQLACVVGNAPLRRGYSFGSW